MQILVAKYRWDGTCETTQSLGPIGVVHGLYEQYVVVDLGDRGFYSDLGEGKRSYTRLAIVHPDNLMTVPEGWG